MKPNSSLRNLLAASGFSLLAISSAYAGILTWDGNGSTAPNPNGGTGTWDTSTTNWWSGTTNVVWPGSSSDNDAVFANTAGTVSLAAGGVTVRDMAFFTSGYLIQGETLTLNGVIPAVVTNSGVTATIQSPISLWRKSAPVSGLSAPFRRSTTCWPTWG